MHVHADDLASPIKAEQPFLFPCLLLFVLPCWGSWLQFAIFGGISIQGWILSLSLMGVEESAFHIFLEQLMDSIIVFLRVKVEFVPYLSKKSLICPQGDSPMIGTWRCWPKDLRFKPPLRPGAYPPAEGLVVCGLWGIAGRSGYLVEGRTSWPGHHRYKGKTSWNFATESFCPP